jgi:choline dehydrogenase-like flavoprotein
VEAEFFALAGGGLETTRLLLASNSVEADGIGNRSGHLGRYYTGHVFGSVAEIQFRGDPRRTIYGFERDSDGIYCRRRFWLAPETQRKEGLLNTAFWPTNPPAADPQHRNGILSSAYIALSLPLLRDKLAAPAIQKMFCGESAGQSYWPHVRNIFLDLPRASLYEVHFLYRRFVTERRIPALFVYSPANRYDLYYHAEQAPNRGSRVELADDVDRFGMRRLRVDLRYCSQDIDSVVRAHEVLVREMQDHQRVARIDYKRDDVYGHVLEQATDGYHQIGTTRMAASERHGVVDGHCRIHGVENLYVCSSSVFPTSGHANPTLTIVALAVRLAHHIGDLCGRA